MNHKFVDCRGFVDFQVSVRQVVYFDRHVGYYWYLTCGEKEWASLPCKELFLTKEECFQDLSKFLIDWSLSKSYEQDHS